MAVVPREDFNVVKQNHSGKPDSEHVETPAEISGSTEAELYDAPGIPSEAEDEDPSQRVDIETQEAPTARLPTEEEDLPALFTFDESPSPREADLAFRRVRRFHVSGPESDYGDTIGDDFLPALLHPFRDKNKIRTSYPLFLFPPGQVQDDRLTRPVNRYLMEVVESFAPQEEQARILKDNLKRIERFLRKALEGQPLPQDASYLMDWASNALIAELALSRTASEELERDMESLREAIPPGTTLLGFGEHATYNLLLHAARHWIPARRQSFFLEVRDLSRKLRDLLEVERQKSQQSRSAHALQHSMGAIAERFLDFDNLAGLIGEIQGTEPMPEKRYRRITETLAVLDAFLEQDEEPHIILVHAGQFPPDWVSGSFRCEVLKKNSPCLAAADIFRERASRMAEVFKAVRIARLEVAGEFEPGLHKPLFKHWTWQSFNRDELRLLAPVVAVEDPDSLVGQALVSLSKLIISGLPVHVLVRTVATGSPGIGSDQDPLTTFRFELGFLGISYREALVEQSSAARPNHLMESFKRGLDTTRTSMFVVASGLCRAGVVPRLGAWLHSGAALESRAHPFFRYDPRGGESWADRFDFSGNPQYQLDWPVYTMDYRAPDGSIETIKLSFTFADFCLLEPSLQDHFRHLTPGYDEDAVIPVHAWVKLPWAEALHKVPTVWAVDSKKQLHRLAISRALALACKDRLLYWRSLQELAGINNVYAKRAAERAREIARVEAQAELAEVRARYQEELDRIQREAASGAMERLAAALVGGDITTMGLPAATPPSGMDVGIQATETEPEAPAQSSTEAARASEAEEDLSFEDPYIDTPLCTSCNECVNINPAVFTYNANKQAVIADAAAGTFQDLVVAAEKCPGRCIHPGKPLNPDEPGLEALLERATPFN